MTRPSTAPVQQQWTGGAVVFTVLVGLSGLAILLQGLWAGIFLEHDGQREAASTWIDVHQHGGEVALIAAAVAAVVGLVRLRRRRDLWIGAVVLTVLIALEAYLGGQIRDEGKDALTAVHVPLALAIMALAVWVLLRARRPAGAA